MSLKITSVWGGLCLLFSVGSATAQNTPNTLAASTNHTVSIRPDGSLWAWGNNLDGQLGNGSTANSTSPVRVLAEATTKWAQVAAGNAHTLAITTDGRLFAWGSNNDGQLGEGATATRYAKPVAVALPADVANATWQQVAAGTSHSLALTTDGRLFAWGNNNNGQLGNGTSLDRTTPIEVAMPQGAANTKWAQVAAGNAHSMALTADGRLFAWGNNQFGQLGDGSTMTSLQPVAVALPKRTTDLRWVQVAAGRYHTLALTADGRVFTWGSNRLGQLGEGSAQQNLPAPLAVPSRLAGTKWTQVAAGEAHSLALSADGRLFAWGNNDNGQLGSGSMAARQVRPVAVALPQNMTATTWARVASGGFHTLASTADGRLCTWGTNNCGQLGDGTTAGRNRPVSQALPTTSRTETDQSDLNNHHSSEASKAWGLNDTRMLNDMPEAPAQFQLSSLMVVATL